MKVDWVPPPWREKGMRKTYLSGGDRLEEGHPEAGRQPTEA